MLVIIALCGETISISLLRFFLFFFLGVGNLHFSSLAGAHNLLILYLIRRHYFKGVVRHALCLQFFLDLALQIPASQLRLDSAHES